MSIPTFIPSQFPVLKLPPVWNPKKDPLPPLQPKEYSFTFIDYQFYYVTATGDIVQNMTVPGYSYYSYSQQSAG